MLRSLFVSRSMYNINENAKVERYVEIIRGQLYFAITKGEFREKLESDHTTIYFSIDDELVYKKFYNDFGPLNISCVCKYCCQINKHLRLAQRSTRVVHYTCSRPDKKANAACLMGLFCVIYLRLAPVDVMRALNVVGPYQHYPDASPIFCGFTIRILDCLQACLRFLQFNFINFDDFSFGEYDYYDATKNGSLNWMVPGKFLAFTGPTENGKSGSHPPGFYVNYFLRNDVTTIIRLNDEAYDAAVFKRAGIEHFDLIFPDGSNPPEDVLLAFLAVAESAPAAVAVHCKAGLGRTGSLIGAYLIKHYHVTAKEAIAWMRLCRPGSVMGPQQIWLQILEAWLWVQGDDYRVRRYGDVRALPVHAHGIYSKTWRTSRLGSLCEERRASKLRYTFVSN